SCSPPPSYFARSSTGEAPDVRRGQRHPPRRAPAPRGRKGTTRWSSSLALERSEGTASPGISGRPASIGAPASDFKQNRKACPQQCFATSGRAGAASPPRSVARQAGPKKLRLRRPRVPCRKQPFSVKFTENLCGRQPE